LKYKVSRVGLNFIYHKASRSKECGMNHKKCPCVIRTSYWLPCVYIIAINIHHKKHLQFDELNSHWKWLHFEVDDVMEEGHPDVWLRFLRIISPITTSLKNASSQSSCHIWKRRWWCI